MPRINRIRIVNFSYNNDTRHIIDESFNFHGGENALLNLANGGGKSVLVQLMLQVLVPGVKIQGRNISSFFRKKKLPAYIMIEWKLDGRGGYLLTGIGIAAAEAAEQEGVRPRVRYFNFTSKYTGANAYDITSIPLMERNGDILDIKPFREARKIMADKGRKDPYLVGYYPEDEGDGYVKRLAEFGIVQDEWRHIIAKINDSENGLEDLFQKYRNSSQLLDDWIIKTVEKVMFKSRTEQRQLEEMLHSLVQDVLENEHFIMEKQLFTGFLGRLQEVSAELSTLLTDLEAQKKLEASLAALHNYLGEEINTRQDQLQANQETIDAARIEEKRIALEERSHDYFIREGEHQEAAARLMALEESCRETEEALSQAKKEEVIMRAAGLAMEIQQMSSELSGVQEKLAMAKEDYDQDDRAARLAYGLKIRYEERLEALAAELASLHGKQNDRQKRLESEKQELKGIEAQKSCLDSDQGRLKERLRTFKDQEKQLQKRLGRQWIRNLLGELDPATMEQIRNSLQEARDRVLKASEKALADKSSLIQHQQHIDQKWKEIQHCQAENDRILRDYDLELEEYRQKEQTVQEILGRYGFDHSLCFDPERRSSLFAKQTKDMESQSEAAARNRHEIAEALLSIKNGHLHTSQELAAALAELDIQYDTGESYLRNQPSDIRSKMLMGNPILPYAFIMSRSDLNRILESGGLDLVQRRIIPLMAYEDLNLLIENQNGLARPREEIAFACLYEGRIFDGENLHHLIVEMEEKEKEAAERCDHYSEAHRLVVLDRAACESFDYVVDYHYELEKNISAGEKRRGHLEQQVTGLEEEKEQIIKRLHQLDQEAAVLAGQLPGTEEALQTFRIFLDKEADYQDNRMKLKQIEQEILTLEQKKGQLNQSLEKLQADISLGINHITTQESKKQQSEQQYLLYHDAPPAEDVEGSIEELEQRLAAIKQEYSQEIGLLEHRQLELTAQLKKTKKQLDKMGLSEEDYASTLFDEAAHESIQEQIIGLDSVLKIKEQEKLAASRTEASTATGVQVALAEVKRLGAEAPLSPQEIKGDFDGRRVKLRQHSEELDNTNRSLSRQLSIYSRTREDIAKAVDLNRVEADHSFVPEADVRVQASRWEDEFRNLENQNRINADKIRYHYNNCKIDYREKNLNLDSIFKGLDPLWDKAQTEYEDFYYLFERMSQHGEKLSELIAIYESQLANLERNKKDMVQQSYLQGRRIFEEIQLISENSKVRLPGRSRPVQMLKIDLQLDNHESAQQRVNEYIEECIAKVREKARQENREDEIRKAVARLMASRELLNIYHGTAHIPVSVFKIDMNMQNSRLKSWEDAVRENSGGEKFVVFFSLLSALMSYTRARNMEALGADPDNDTRVLIMDNPFGPISSEHLLQPMFEIAKRHRTQLICLSDLKQNSIMNCFNLIYMLKVRTGAIDGKEYLKFEEHVRDENTLPIDEKLEKAIYRASGFKQMPLFSEEEH